MFEVPRTFRTLLFDDRIMFYLDLVVIKYQLLTSVSFKFNYDLICLLWVLGCILVLFRLLVGLGFREVGGYRGPVG